MSGASNAAPAPLTGGLALLAEQQAAERAAAAARVATVAVKRTANKIVLSKPKADPARAPAAAGAAPAAAAAPAPAAAGAGGVAMKPGGTVVDPHKTFEALDADAVLETMNTMQSLCMNCHAEDAETKLLLTRIPYFRDVIIMSTECAHCNYRTNEIQPANEIAEKGVRYELTVEAGKPHTKQDLNRQIIKAETATVLIPTIEFELPAASSKRGEINTLEGFLVSFAENLELLQHERREKVPQLAAALQPVIEKLRAFADGKQTFTFVVDDPAGNSFFENVLAAAAKPDPRVAVTHYTRTAAQQEELGYAPDATAPAVAAATAAAAAATAGKGLNKAGAKITHSEKVHPVHMSESMFAKMDSYFDVTERAATLPGECPGCHKECDTRMCVVDVPFFKDIILMVTQCDNCGYKDSEVKPAGEVSEFGVKVTLTVQSAADLKRDMLKSDSAGISIPELDLELHEGTLGGKYTTLEGLFNDIKESLARVNPFHLGDSSDTQHKSKMAEFMARLEELLFTVSRPFHLILDDPMGNSFIQSLTGDKPDPQLVIEKYRRTHAQNEELGLNDMKTEGYNPELAADEGAAAAAKAGVKAPAAAAAAAAAVAVAVAAGNGAAAEKHKPSDDFSFPSKADSRFAAPEVQVTATGSAPMVPGTDANPKTQAAAAAAAPPAAAAAAAAAAKK